MEFIPAEILEDTCLEEILMSFLMVFSLTKNDTTPEL